MRHLLCALLATSLVAQQAEVSDEFQKIQELILSRNHGRKGVQSSAFMQGTARHLFGLVFQPASAHAPNAAAVMLQGEFALGLADSYLGLLQQADALPRELAAHLPALEPKRQAHGPMLPALRRGATSDDPELVQFSLPFLAFAGRGDPAAQDALRGALRHASADVRWRAAWGLRWSAGTPAGREAVPALRESLRDQSVLVRAFAAASLCTLCPEDPGLLPAAGELFASEEEVVLRLAAHVCRTLALLPPEALPALVKLLSSPDDASRLLGLRLACVLGPLAGGVREALEKAAASHDLAIATAAREALAMLPRPVPPVSRPTRR